MVHLAFFIPDLSTGGVAREHITTIYNPIVTPDLHTKAHARYGLCPVLSLGRAGERRHRGAGVRLPGGEHGLPERAGGNPGRGKVQQIRTGGERLGRRHRATLDNPPPRGRLRDRAQFFSVDRAVECYLNVLLGD